MAHERKPWLEPVAEPPAPSDAGTPTRRATQRHPDARHGAGPAAAGAGRHRHEGPRPAGPARRAGLVLRPSPTAQYDAETVEAVRGFQEKRRIPVTGEVDQRTLDRLHAMTGEPSRDAMGLHNVPGPLDAALPHRPGALHRQDQPHAALGGRRQGPQDRRRPVRRRRPPRPARASFSVYLKSRDHVSQLYDSAMPFAMFFSGGQAVHYSSDFAAAGYGGASHGCVNVRDYDAVAWLYDQVAGRRRGRRLLVLARAA